MHLRNPALFALMVVSLTACMGSLRPSTPLVYFDVAYSNDQTACENTQQEAVRVWRFSASTPFDRDEMVVLDSSRQMRFSPQYRWVAIPGVMLSDQIIRDLTGTNLFARVISAGDPFNAPMQLGGRIFQFGWKENGSHAFAVLDLEVSLWKENPERKILFRKRFQMESKEQSNGSPERFAEAMSGLVEEFSIALQRDLCATLKGNSSRDGG